MSRRPEAQEPVYVVALGASTAVGRDVWSSAAAVRAGISGFAQHPYMIDQTGEPMRVAPAPWLDSADVQGRFKALLFPALLQALAPFDAEDHVDIRIGLALGLPPVRPGVPANLEPALRADLARSFGDRFGAIAMFAAGHAAGFIGMRAAYPKLASGIFGACVIAGVDSYLIPETLEWLEQNDQLHGAGMLNNAWGFIPGEAAGAALLMGAATVDRLRLEPLARVRGIGEGMEANRIKTQTVCLGEGLTAAFRQSLAELPAGTKVTEVFCDLNGEPYRADEFAFACLRTREAFEAASDFVAPADCWGDVAAASAPLSLALSSIAFGKSYAKGAYAFAWASSESGERGSALLERCPSGRR